MFGKNKAQDATRETLTRPDALPDDFKLAFEKIYTAYGTQYDSWINEKVPRSKVIKKLSAGDPVTLRRVPYKSGHMYLAVHVPTGLDFGIFSSKEFTLLRHQYWGCIMEGTVVDPTGPDIAVKIYQPPVELEE